MGWHGASEDCEWWLVSGSARKGGVLRGVFCGIALFRRWEFEHAGAEIRGWDLRGRNCKAVAIQLGRCGRRYDLRQSLR